MIGVHKAFSPILVEEYSETFELLVVEETLGGKKQLQIISGHGPQETWKMDNRLPFLQALEEEITKAGLAGKSVIVSLD